MKKLFLNIIMQIACILPFSGLFAQGTPSTTTYFEFTYDASGNRTQRRVIEIPDNQNSRVLDTNAQSGAGNDSTAIFTDKMGNIKLSLYPNPTRGNLTFKIVSDTVIFNSEMTVYNATGTFITHHENLRTSETFDFSTYSAGIYYLKFSINNIEKTFKVIKQD